MWEIYSLSIIDELKTRAALKKLSEFELDILYARAKTRLWEKMERLRGVPGLSLSDFGTRRRHSFLWQEYVVKAMSDVLGTSFTGSSNTYLAYKHDLEAIGTNAHELPMALAALADSDEELRTAQYRLLELWQQTYQGELLILLPDTFGTTQFLRDAPDWVADWTGQRIDSKDPFVAGDEYIAWLEERGRDPRRKRLIASDALDVDRILALHAYFRRDGSQRSAGGGFSELRRTFAMRGSGFRTGAFASRSGWGTFLTNDFRNCNPRGDSSFNPGQPGVQAGGGRRPAGGEALRQLRQSHGPAGRDRALSCAFSARPGWRTCRWKREKADSLRWRSPAGRGPILGAKIRNQLRNLLVSERLGEWRHLRSAVRDLFRDLFRRPGLVIANIRKGRAFLGPGKVRTMALDTSLVAIESRAGLLVRGGIGVGEWVRRGGENKENGDESCRIKTTHTTIFA